MEDLKNQHDAERFRFRTRNSISRVWVSSNFWCTLS